MIYIGGIFIIYWYFIELDVTVRQLYSIIFGGKNFIELLLEMCLAEKTLVD